MTTQAISGVGTEFHRWNGSEWEAIAEITSIKGPGPKREQIEVTSLDSVGGYKEFIAGFRESGTISLTMNFRRSNYDLMLQDFESDELQNYEIILSDPVQTSFEFTGLVTELPLNITAKDAVTMDVTILISGPIVVNSGEESGSPSSFDSSAL
jgi:predicted secreted protein